MVSFCVRKMFSSAVATVVACAGISVMSAANAPTSYPVIYTASGTFGATPISGADTLRLAGEPFTIKIGANTSLVPNEHGQNWAVYQGLQMTGTIYSGLLGAQPTPVNSPQAGLQLTTGPKDIINAGFPVSVIGLVLDVTAKVYLPGGTFANPHIATFPSAVIQSGSTMQYADSSASTVLSIASGTVVAAIPGQASVVPHMPNLFAGLEQ